MLDEKIKTAIKEYQCPGCVVGISTKCYKKGNSEACENHIPGTIITGIGTIFLGMPKGFNRLGMCNDTKIHIFNELKNGWVYDKFKVPIWKHRDGHGNILVRGIYPRINYPWIHIFLTDCLAEINCLELTSNEMTEMD